MKDGESVSVAMVGGRWVGRESRSSLPHCQGHMKESWRKGGKKMRVAERRMRKDGEMDGRVDTGCISDSA